MILQHPKNIDNTYLVRTISAPAVVLACAGQQIE